jgi:hypothetical protein
MNPTHHTTQQSNDMATVTWQNVLTMIQDLAETLAAQTNGRPCTAEMIHGWIMRILTERPFISGIECRCEESAMCAHALNDSDFETAFNDGLFKIAKAIVLNMTELNHTNPDVLPLEVREKILEDAYYRYGNGNGDEEYDENEEDYEDYEMSDEEMFANAYSTMYGPGFVY